MKYFAGCGRENTNQEIFLTGLQTFIKDEFNEESER
jgi:hypothetical protein